MNAALISLLSRYRLDSPTQYLKALREIIQHICLIGLWRTRFFERAAFCGGTALRIVHGLPRYSEDLDFSLLNPNPAFSFDSYAKSLEEELRSFGFSATAERKRKDAERKTESAFVKTNTLQSMLVVDAPARFTQHMHRDARLKIKLEVDTDPPLYGESEVRSMLTPIPFQLRIGVLPSMFAGKIHALLCRSWRSRLKGRDFFDYIWFVGREVPCDMRHLSARLVQSGNLEAGTILDREALMRLLHQRFAGVDIRRAVEDAIPFVDDRQSLDLWSVDFFKEVTQRIAVV